MPPAVPQIDRSTPSPPRVSGSNTPKAAATAIHRVSFDPFHVAEGVTSEPTQSSAPSAQPRAFPPKPSNGLEPLTPSLPWTSGWWTGWSPADKAASSSQTLSDSRPGDSRSNSRCPQRCPPEATGNHRLSFRGPSSIAVSTRPGQLHSPRLTRAACGASSANGRNPADKCDVELAQLKRKLERSEAELVKARRVIEIHGNVSALLEEMLGTDSMSRSTER